MRNRAAIWVCLLSAVCLAFGDNDRLPVLKVGDNIYSNVLVLRVTSTDIYFSSSSGISNAKLADLEPAMQQRFAADAAKAGEMEQKQSEGNAQYERALAAQTPAPASGQSGNEMSPTNSSATNEPLAKTFLNQTGPDWPKSQKWISGSPNVEGKFVLFDLWATTNAPSRNFIPTLNDFLKKFGSQLVIVGFSNESEDEVRAVVDPNIEYSSVLDPDNELQTTLELKEFPYALLMDTNRTVRWEGNPLNKTNALTEAVLSSFLTNMPPATPPPASDASAQ